MKIEDLNYKTQTTPIDENEWNLEKWRKDYPMDYLKALHIIEMADNPIVQSYVFKEIYKIIQLHIPDTLYKYYSLTNDEDINEKKLSTLTERKIYMSDIKDFNDPYDSKCFFYNSDELADIERLKPFSGRIVDDFTAYIKGTALTENGIQSMPMWAHYSNNHAGFCVSYDMNKNILLKSCTFPVQYISERLDITSLIRKQALQITAKIDNQLKTGQKEIIIDDLTMILVPQLLYNLKFDQWSYEKEYRCSTAFNTQGMPYIEALPKEIYIGMNCIDKHKRKLIDIGKRLEIPVYQMLFDENKEKCELVTEIVN